MAKETASSDAVEEEREAILDSPDTDDSGEIDVERFELPSSQSIDDPYLREVWDQVRSQFAGGQFAGELYDNED